MAAKEPKPKPAVPVEPETRRKRNVIFVSLDDDTEERLKRFLVRQRIAPDRAAVAFTALVEFLDREEKRER